MLKQHSSGRSRTLAARVAVVASAGALALGCGDRERPTPIADPRGEEGSRAVSGSFRAPGASGAGSASAGADDAGAAVSGSGASGAGGAATAGPTALQQTYEGTCEDANVQWGFFTFEAETPGDSSVLFRLRTAASEAALESSSFVDLVTASALFGTERCGFTGPAPCPIDLYEMLGGAPLAHEPFAQLHVLLSQASGDGRMPAVEAWQLTYSCTFNQ
jgi:hypothetical protein